MIFFFVIYGLCLKAFLRYFNFNPLKAVLPSVVLHGWGTEAQKVHFSQGVLWIASVSLCICPGHCSLLLWLGSRWTLPSREVSQEIKASSGVLPGKSLQAGFSPGEQSTRVPPAVRPPLPQPPLCCRWLGHSPSATRPGLLKAACGPPYTEPL